MTVKSALNLEFVSIVSDLMLERAPGKEALKPWARLSVKAVHAFCANLFVCKSRFFVDLLATNVVESGEMKFKTAEESKVS